MTDAQGIYKQLSYKKQTAKGTASSGSGGQLLRRETATFNLQKDTYSANEINSHQQHTGDKHGIGKVNGSLNGNVSPATYKDMLQSLLRKDFAATSNITGVAATIAGSGPYTITDAASTFLTDGIKIGDVIRLAAAGLDAANAGKNLLVTGVTETVITVIVVNGSDMTAEGPIADVVVSVPGKKAWVPTASHTNDYYTFEEWLADLTKSRTYTDCQIGKADIALPATGLSTIALTIMGLGRTKGGSQVLTSPTAETSTEILAAVNGVLLVGGTTYGSVTGLTASLDGQMNFGEAVIGSNLVSDITKGDVKASGSFTAVKQSETLSDFLDSENATSIIAVVAANDDADADFVTLVFPRVKILSDDADDGKKQIVETFNWTAEIEGSGGAALANHETIVSVQDSAA
jgi:hypothetical protein